MQAIQNIDLPSFLDTLISLAAAFLLGGLIGLERQYRQRTAGLRTNVLVAVGAAIFVDIANRLAGAEGATRVIAYVVSGIGFLGAGVIIKEGVAVRGLTTAASIWITSAIGILAGVGFYFPLIAVTLFSLCALSLFRRIEAVLPAFSYASHSVVVPVESAIDEPSLKSFLRSLGFDVHQVSCLRDLVARTVRYDMTIRTKARGGLAQLNSAWASRRDVVSYSITPL